MDIMIKSSIRGFISSIICIPIMLLMFLSISFVGFDTKIHRAIDCGIFFTTVLICSAINCIEWKV